VTVALECFAVSKSFDALRAVDNISFSMMAGAISALIGPNGAGKTTLFNVVTNLFPATSGEVRFFGTNVRGLSPAQLARMGVLRTFQSARVITGMTLLENVLTGAYLHRQSTILSQMFWVPSAWTEERRLVIKAEGLLDSFGLLAYRDVPAAELPMGIQKVAEILRALMTDPKLLLLDEPAAGLNDKETADLALFLLALRKLGISVLVVEHNMPLVMGVAREIFVMDAGKLVAHGSPDEIRGNPHVLEAYLGKAAI
jgi:branched-chain amino acid transport system ATP-binding protein